MEKGFSVSLKGLAHDQNGKPKQDYASAIKGEGFSIAVVCDGHGSDKHFRSEVGSQVATEVTEAILLDFAKQFPDYESAAVDFGKKSEQIRIGIVSKWADGVCQNSIDNPFTEKELQSGVAKGVDYFSKYSMLVPYGTTILAVLLCKDYYLALMIGDGAMIRILPDKDAVEETFEGKAFGDRVESMCNQNSAFKIYTKLVKLEEGMENIAFVLTSDGYCESEAFTSRDMMLNWPKKYLAFIAAKGADEAYEPIAKQLEQVSAVSSANDDISIAIAVNDISAYMPKPKPQEEKPEAEKEQPAEQATEQPTEQATEQPTEQATEQATEQVAEEATEPEQEVKQECSCENQPKAETDENDGDDEKDARD